MANFTRWPSIRLTMADRERLERLANAGMHRYPHTADYLAHEIERARIVRIGKRERRLRDDGVVC